MNPQKYQSGFTILEIVITLIVASILGAIFLEFMGTSVQKSYVPVENARKTLAINEILELMNADYRKLIRESSTPLEEFRTRVESLAYAGGDYTFETAYVAFTDEIDSATFQDVDENAENRVFKVKITHGGRSITTLFTR
jgi:prepilin-type N-terminal cleavage/methylation domain-containing protein